MKIIRNGGSIEDRTRMENAEALTMQNKAMIDYIAMMTDVEIPTEETGETNETNGTEE